LTNLERFVVSRFAEAKAFDAGQRIGIFSMLDGGAVRGDDELTSSFGIANWPAPLNPIQMNWQGSLASGS